MSIARFITAWEAKIGNYEITDPRSHVETPEQSALRAEALLGGADSPGMQALHAGVTLSSRAPNARQRFLRKLGQVLADAATEVQITGEDQRTTHPENYLANLDRLLGADGIALYKAAIAEERNSAEFRNALFLSSTKHYEGPRWTERMVLWVAGESASGKSTAADAIIQKAGADLMPHVPPEDDDYDAGNQVVSIDGGIEREISQMRQMVLQVALKKGFAGIDELDEQADLNAKKFVARAAEATENLNIVIPCTFTSNLRKDSIKKYAEMENTKQIFSKIVGGEIEGDNERLQRSVHRMGSSRAWSNRFGPEDTYDREISMNNRNINCESKKHLTRLLAIKRRYASLARGVYESAQEDNQKESVYLTVTNDLVFVNKNSRKNWVESTPETPTRDTIPTTVRALQAWKRYKKSELAAKRTPQDFDEWVGYRAWKLYVAEEEARRRTPLRFDKWVKANKPEMAKCYAAQIDTYINKQQKFKATKHPNPVDPLCLGNALLADIEKGGIEQKNAINSLFDVVGQMEPAAKAALYTSLKQNLDIPHERHGIYDEIILAYRTLADIQLRLTKAKKELAELNFVRRKIPLGKTAQLNATIADAETQEKIIKDLIGADDFKQKIAEIKNEVSGPTKNNPVIWSQVMNDIPLDPLNGNNIFAQPMSLMETNKPRHDELRRKLSRNLNHYRYVAPKGEGGAQESGPQGGWYITCYKTPDGRIHTQRMMIKREDKFRKNIIESLCGRLKSRLANPDEDYIASTYLVRDPDRRAVGPNTYAVSIAFSDFKETHKLVGLNHRVRMAGTKQKFFDGDAKKIFNKIQHLHDKKYYSGLEESLIASWWTADSDVHSGNIGVGKKLKRFLNIDHAGGMIWLDPKVHPNRHGLWQNMKRSLRPLRYFWNKEKRSPEPTYHAHEYPAALRCSKKMARAIRHYANRMDLPDLYAAINDEINTAVDHYYDDPNEFRKFAKRIGVPDAWIHNDDGIDEIADASKAFLKEIMYSRLVNLRQYGREIELSLCFEFDKNQDDFVLKHPQTLIKFIRENPNYCLNDRHHFRGKSHGQRRSILYHKFHNKFGHGAHLENLLQQATKLVLDKLDPLGVEQFLVKDFKVPDPNDRAKNYITRLILIQEILKNEGELDSNPYHHKIAELIKHLLLYSSNVLMGSRKQHLIQVCDDAYSTIQHIFQDLDIENNASFIAKVKIFETLSQLENPELMDSYTNIIQNIPELHKKRAEAIALQFERPLIKQLATFSVENSAYTRAINLGAKSLDTLATHAAFAGETTAVNDLERKRQILGETVTKLSELTRSLEKLQPAKEHIDSAQQKLHVKDDAERATKQLYLVKTRPLTKIPGKTYEEQTKEFLKHDTDLAHHTTATVVDPKLTLGDIVTEDKAVFLENPANPTASGAVMCQEEGLLKLIDFEDPRISFANLLARELREHTHTNPETSVEELRKYIQEHYINVIQSKLKPETVTKENLYHLLIQPMANNKIFNFILPGSTLRFFGKGESFAEKVYQHFHETIAWHPQLIAWANVWVKAFEAKGTDIRDVVVEHSHGNAEFARLLIILLCAKGAKLNAVNRTGYDMHVTDADIKRMNDILENPKNAEHAKVMQYTADLKQAKHDVKHAAALMDAPIALTTAVKGIRDRLMQEPVPSDIKALYNMRGFFVEDMKQMQSFQKLDKNDRYLQIYNSLEKQLNAKIKVIDDHLRAAGETPPTEGIGHELR